MAADSLLSTDLRSMPKWVSISNSVSYSTKLNPRMRYTDFSRIFEENKLIANFTGTDEEFFSRSFVDWVTNQTVINDFIDDQLLREEDRPLRDKILPQNLGLVFAISLRCFSGDPKRITMFLYKAVKACLNDSTLPWIHCPPALATDEEFKRLFDENFKDKQSQFCVPIFEQHFSEPLWDKCTLPIYRFHDEPIGKGAYAEVFKVKIHPDFDKLHPPDVRAHPPI